MPASRAEQVLDALKALLEMVPDAVVERNSVLPEKVPAGGLIIMRDGDPGEPEQALGGFGNTYYQHAVEIEVYVEEGDPGQAREQIHCIPPPVPTAATPAAGWRRRRKTPNT
jgi:hypothetical protein